MVYFKSFLVVLLTIFFTSNAGLYCFPVADSCLRMYLANDYISRDTTTSLFGGAHGSVNPDSVMIDTCSGSATYQHLFAKKWFIIQFPKNFYPFNHILDSGEVKEVSDIDSSHLALLNRFLQLQDTLGLIYFQGLDDPPSDSVVMLNPLLKLSFENYQDVDYVVEHFKNTVDSVKNLAYELRALEPQIVPNDNGMKANNPISEIYVTDPGTFWPRNFRPKGFHSNLYNIFCPMAWELTYGGNDVFINIPDIWSSTELNHPDLEGNFYYSTLYGDSKKTLNKQTIEHGLEVMGCAIARNDNSITDYPNPMVGSSPRCRAIATYATTSDIDLDQDVNNFMKYPDIQSMSAGVPGSLKTNLDLGIVWVAAGHNSRDFYSGIDVQLPNKLWNHFPTTNSSSEVYTDPSDPDLDTRIICVGATQDGILQDQYCEPWPSSWKGPNFSDNIQFIPNFNFGPGNDKFNRSTNATVRKTAKEQAMMDIVAPGSTIVAWGPPHYYNVGAVGTSMATPTVAGIIGLMLSANKYMGVPLQIVTDDKDVEHKVPVTGKNVHRKVYDILTFTAKKIPDYQNFTSEIYYSKARSEFNAQIRGLSVGCTSTTGTLEPFTSIEIDAINGTKKITTPDIVNTLVNVSEPIEGADGYKLNIRLSTGSARYVAVFIDKGNDGSFSSTEKVYPTTTPLLSSSHDFIITLPNAPYPTLVERRMRIVCNSNTTDLAMTAGCGYLTSGQVYDFQLNMNSAGYLTTTDQSGRPFQYSYITQWNDKLKRSWAQRVGFGLVDAYRAVAHSIRQKGLQEYSLSGAMSLDFDAADGTGDQRGYTMPAQDGTPYMGRRAMHWGAKVKEGDNPSMFEMPLFRGPTTGNDGELNVLDWGGVSLPGEFHNNQGVTKITSSDNERGHIDVQNGCILAIDGILFSDQPEHCHYIKTTGTTKANSSIIEMSGMIKDVEIYGNLRIGDVILDGSTDEGDSDESGCIGFGTSGDEGDNFTSEIYGKVDVINKGYIYANGDFNMYPGASVNLQGDKDFRLKGGWAAEEIIRNDTMKHNTQITSTTGRKVTVEDGVTLWIDSSAVVNIDCELNVKNHGTVVLKRGSVAKIKFLNIEPGGTIIIDTNATLALEEAKQICDGNFEIHATNWGKAKIVGQLSTTCLATDAISDPVSKYQLYSDYPYIQTQPIIFMKGDCSNPIAQSLKLRNTILKDVSINGSDLRIFPIDSCEFYSKTDITNPTFKFDYLLSLYYNNCQTCENDEFKTVWIKNSTFKDLTQPLPPLNNSDINKLIYNTGGVIVEGYDLAEIQNTKFGNLEFGVNTFDCKQTYIHNSRFDSCGVGDYDFASTTMLCQDTFNIVKFGSVRDRSLTGKVFNNEYNKSRIAFSAISSQEQRLRDNIFDEYVVGISSDCTPIRIGDLKVPTAGGIKGYGLVYGRNKFIHSAVTGYPNSHNNYLAKECEYTEHSADISFANSCCSLFMECGHNEMSPNTFYNLRYTGLGTLASTDVSHNFFPPDPGAVNNSSGFPVSGAGFSSTESRFDDYYCCGDIKVSITSPIKSAPGWNSCAVEDGYSETCIEFTVDHPSYGEETSINPIGISLIQNNLDNTRNIMIDILQKNEFMAMYGDIIKGKNAVENLSRLSEIMDKNRDLSTAYPDFDRYKMLIDLKLHKAGRLNSYPTALTGQPNIQRMFAREGSSNTSVPDNSLLKYSGSLIDFKCENTSDVEENTNDNVILHDIRVSIEPNPVNDATNISFYLPSKSKIKVYLINALGEVVDNISNAVYSEGRNSINYQNSTLSNGIYYCIFEWKGGMKSEKIMLIR
ncbi:MAG: S8 family serine peptidase [Candidatus Kapaibacterium sp.]